MPSGPAPKPDAERLRRNAPTFGWVDLPPDGREGPIPDLPEPAPWLVELGGWPVATRAAWKRLWVTPQATQWDQDGTTLHGWAAIHAAMALKGPTSGGQAELRQIEQLHGLSPRALLQLRWRVVAADSAPAPQRLARTERRLQVLKWVAEDGDEAKAPAAKGRKK